MPYFGDSLDERLLYFIETFSGQLVKRRGALDHGGIFRREKETWIQWEAVVSDDL